MMIMNNQPLLEVRNLKVEIPTRKGTLIALEDVSFNLKAGEILGVVGESGAGKSMVGNSIIGLLGKLPISRTARSYWKGSVLITCRTMKWKRSEARISVRFSRIR